MKKLQGYNFSRKFYGERAPQHVQNIVIRDYCLKNGYVMRMSATEYAIPGSAMILKQIVNNMAAIDGIVAYSVLQLPECRRVRSDVISKVIKNGKEFHFAVEGLIIYDEMSAQKIEMLMDLKKEELVWDSENKK